MFITHESEDDLPKLTWYMKLSIINFMLGEGEKQVEDWLLQMVEFTANTLISGTQSRWFVDIIIILS